jgi:hypothetical protein
MTVPTCPDCREGKCRVCCGIALDDNDQVTECACPACHEVGPYTTPDCLEEWHQRCQARGSDCLCGCHAFERVVEMEARGQ